MRRIGLSLFAIWIALSSGVLLVSQLPFCCMLAKFCPMHHEEMQVSCAMHMAQQDNASWKSCKSTDTALGMSEVSEVPFPFVFLIQTTTTALIDTALLELNAFSLPVPHQPPRTIV